MALVPDRRKPLDDDEEPSAALVGTSLLSAADVPTSRHRFNSGSGSLDAGVDGTEALDDRAERPEEVHDQHDRDDPRQGEHEDDADSVHPDIVVAEPRDARSARRCCRLQAAWILGAFSDRMCRLGRPEREALRRSGSSELEPLAKE